MRTLHRAVAPSSGVCLHPGSFLLISPLPPSVASSKMATVRELKAVLKDTLEKRGVLGEVKARIRAEVFNAMDDPNEQRPQLSHENLLINELIREYLEFNRYKYTSSVLTAEAGQPEIPLDRDFLVKELNIVEDPSSKSVPLLYGIITQFLYGNKEGNPHNTFPRGLSSWVSKWNLNKPSNQRSPIGVVLEPGHPATPKFEDTLIPQNIHR